MTSIFVHRPLWLRRSVFVAAHVVALLALFLISMEPIQGLLADGAEAIAQRQTSLERYLAVSGQAGAIETFAKQVAVSNARGELISGGAPGVVDANLQAHIKSLAAKAGVDVTSLRTLPAKNVRGATLVGARLEVGGPIEAINALARALEAETPILLISAAALRSQTSHWGIVSTQKTAKAPRLEAQFDVFGGALSKDRP